MPKDIRRKPSRRAQILLGYLPTTRLSHIKSKTGRRRALGNLFHTCMKRILEPLQAAGINGIEMTTGSGSVHRCHPIFATFVGDYPEQLLVTCCKSTYCPKCTVPPDNLGDGEMWPPRDLESVLAALATAKEGPTAYKHACKKAGIKDVVNPFWEDLPYVDIFQSITSDILHQLYQGVMKHLISWMKKLFDPAEIDARCRRMPPNHCLRLFSNGITTLSRVSGKEHSDICRILLGIIVDMRLPDNRSSTRLVRCVRSLLDFLYLAQLPMHTTQTLSYLQEALATFHDNKLIFVDLGVRADFNFPKLHSLQHYDRCIRLFGTTDNYNTEYSERLHIDFAKDAYRATNRKDEYPQMTLWLERKEKVLQLDACIRWRLAGQQTSPSQPPQPVYHSHIQMTRHPSVNSVSFDDLVSDYGAIDFRQALTVFIANHNSPDLTRAQLQQAAFEILLPFQRVPIFHKIRFWNEDPQGRLDASDTIDVAHIRPKRKGKKGWIPARFDTVLVDLDAEDFAGVTGES